MTKSKLFTFRVLLFITAVSLAACQAPVDKTSVWTSDTGEVRPGPDTGKAVLALVKKSRQASATGSLSIAESYLERALGIEPDNATLWLYMAKLRLYAMKPKEAINLAKKALSLSSRGGNLTQAKRKALQADGWRVIAHAHQKLGNTVKAQKADKKAKSLSY